MERVKGIEPSSSAWKAEVLPLNYTRKQDSFFNDKYYYNNNVKINQVKFYFKLTFSSNRHKIIIEIRLNYFILFRWNHLHLKVKPID